MRDPCNPSWRNRVRPASSLFFLIGWVLLPWPRADAEVTIEPSGSIAVSVNDNERLQSVDGSGAGSSVTDLRVRALYVRPTYSVDVTPQVRVLRYTSHRELENEDYGVTMNAQRHFERFEFQLGLDYQRELSTTTELTEAGVVDAAVPKTSISTNSSLLYQWSPRFSATAFGSFADITFSGAARGLVDYSSSAAGLSFRYIQSAETALLATTSVSSFSTPDLRSSTTSYAFQVGVEHSLSDVLSARFMVGQNFAYTKFYTDVTTLESLSPVRFATRRYTRETETSGELISVRVERKFLRGLGEVEWDRQFSPSSLGSRLKIQRVYTRGTWRLNDRLRGVLYARYIEQEQESITGQANPQYRVGTGGMLVYRFNQNWSADVSYDYLFRESSLTNSRADSNKIMLEFRYSGEPRLLFR